MGLAATSLHAAGNKILEEGFGFLDGEELDLWGLVWTGGAEDEVGDLALIIDGELNTSAPNDELVSVVLFV